MSKCTSQLEIVSRNPKSVKEPEPNSAPESNSPREHFLSSFTQLVLSFLPTTLHCARKRQFAGVSHEPG